jgi:hypothetical protein
MKALIIGLLIVVFVIVVIGIDLLLGYGAYALVLWAGSPKYIAVIVGIAVFLFVGVSITIKNKK